MATYRVKAPDGSEWDVNAPDGATEDAVMRYAKAQWGAKSKAPDYKPINPTDDMSGLETFAAGMGKKMTDWGRSIGQMTGLTDQASIDEARRLDAPLMETTGGQFGSIAADLGAAFIPGAGTAKGAALLGGAMGALQPTSGDESRLQNIGTSAALAWGLQGAAGKLSSMIKAKAAAGPLEATQNATRDAAIAAGREAGYVAPPSISGAGVVPRLLEGLSGKYKTNQAASIKNQTVSDRLAKRAVGLTDDAQLSPDVLQGIRNKAFAEGYEPVAAAGVVKTDEHYKAALDKIVEKYVGAAKDFPGAADDSVRKFIEGSKAHVIPAKNEWIDDAGRTIGDFVEPKMPPLRNLLDEIKKAGGINVSEVGELNVAKLHTNYPGLLRKNGGKSADGLLEWMRSNGWISESTVKAAEELPGGAQELAKDMIRTALARERVVHPSQFDAWAAYSQDSAEALKAGITKNFTPAQEVRGLRVNEFDAGNGLKMSQILRDEASAAYRSGDKALGKAKREAAKAIEDQVERHLASFGDGAGAKDLLANFRRARELMAKTHTVESALVAESGHVDARKLAQALQKKKPLTGELRTIASFASNAKDVTRVPESGWANPLTAVDFGMVGLGAGVSPYAMALPVARVAARKAILSSPMQAAMGPTYGVGLLGRGAGAALDTDMAKRLGLLAPALYGMQE